VGSYLGGSTLVYLRGRRKAGSKDLPASKADLQAGKNIREAVRAERERKRQADKESLATDNVSESPKLTTRAERRMLHELRVRNARKRKAIKQAAHQAQQAKQQEEKRLRRERKLQLEDQRRDDPAYKKEISPSNARAEARMGSVVVERRTASGRLVKQARSSPGGPTSTGG
jgi:predicted secreted protein